MRGEFAEILTLLSAPLPPQEELSDKMAFAYQVLFEIICVNKSSALFNLHSRAFL